MKNVLVVWRDGRDVLVSQYFHSLIPNDKGNAQLVQRCRADLGFADYDNIQKNLPEFMRYVFEARKNPKMSWSDFYYLWGHRNDLVHVKYEDIRNDPIPHLQRVVKELSGKSLSEARANEIIDAKSFEKMSGRKVGEESTNSFMRKGLVGDWENYFDSNTRKLFNSYAGKVLINLGYEENSSWVDNTTIKDLVG
jgi:hypothetical protein